MKEDIKRYAELTLELRKINAEMEALKTKFKREMEEADVEVAESEFGTVTIYKRRKYIYPEKIVVAEMNLNTMKEEAEQTGTATYSESEYLRFDMPKM